MAVDIMLDPPPSLSQRPHVYILEWHELLRTVAYTIYMHFIPALLTTDTQDLHGQLEKLLPHFTHFQVDIQDGIFVPSRTLNIPQYMEVVMQYATDKQVMLDFHLMLTEYADALAQIAHIPTTPSLFVRTTFVHTNIDPLLLSKATSLTFNPEDGVEEWSDFLRHSTHAQVMTVPPGPQGQPFVPDQLAKIGIIKSINSQCTVCIDGAVSEKTIHTIHTQKPDCVPDECGVGSYFSKAHTGEIGARLRLLQEYV